MSYENKFVDKTTDQLQDTQFDVSDKYLGMPSELVKELWPKPQLVDGQNNIDESRRRNEVLAVIQKKELDRENTKTGIFQDRYNGLSDDDRQSFSSVQPEAIALMSKYAKGELTLTDLPIEEQWIMQKLQETFEKAKKENPDSPQLILSFSQDIDQKVYQNMIWRMSYQILERYGESQDQDNINHIREVINSMPEEDSHPEQAKAIGDDAAKKLESQLLEKLVGNGIVRESQEELHQKLIEDDGTTPKVAYRLISYLYMDLRQAKYQENEDTLREYDEAFQYANNDNSLPHRVENNWIYRGIFPSRSQGLETVTRGSLNVTITPSLIKDLDNLISSGQVKANYKFSSPEGPDNSKRHDSISLYFLEEPSPEVLDQIRIITGKYVRGNNLIGQKITEGFTLSEVGSISDSQAEDFLKNLSAINPELGNAVNQHITKRDDTTGKNRTAMSEGIYYAIKRALECYGIEIDYDKDSGISINI